MKSKVDIINQLKKEQKNWNRKTRRKWYKKHGKEIEREILKEKIENE